MQTTGGLTREQRGRYHDAGFVRLPGFAPPELGERMLDRVVRDRPGARRPPARRARPRAARGQPGGVGRRPRGPGVEGLPPPPPRIDCFLSQFIFKNPGAWGQPWHQDGFYFPFEPPRPIVGAWLAVTEATLDNGCLHVLPGSHHEPVHRHEADRRPGANYGYVEIVDHDMSGSEPVLMSPGDLLLFDSHLMHRSTDNDSTGIRAAMVYHFAATGTVDHGSNVVNDFVTVR
jgi:hypothetical protein